MQRGAKGDLTVLKHASTEQVNEMRPCSRCSENRKMDVLYARSNKTREEIKEEIDQDGGICQG